MNPRVGQSLASTTDDTTVIVIKSPGAEVDLTCGGASMVDAKDPAAATKSGGDAAQQDGTQLGKRYVDDGDLIEVLCTKAGTGTLALDGAVLNVKSAKPLPASD